MRALVVGGGISGLAAAQRLANHGHTTTVVEADDVLGGKLRTGDVGGVRVELGADAFLTREPEAVDLARSVGLDEDLVGPSVLGASIWWDGSLRRLPPGNVLGVPTRLGPLFRGDLLSRRGAARAALDLVLPRRGDPELSTVGGYVRARLGAEVAERLVDPLLAGVHAGDIERLGLAAATPLIADAARRNQSLVRGMRAVLADRGPTGTRPVFQTVRGGLGRLVGRLAATDGVEARTSTPVLGIRRDDGWYVADVDGPFGRMDIGADIVVLAVPAYAAAELVRDIAPDAVAPLRAIPYVSVALVTLVLPAGAQLPSGSGMLVPSAQGGLLKAATWVSQKWSHVGDGRVVVRASVGRRGDRRHADLDDDELVRAVRAELLDLARIHAEPEATSVTRWDRALPQYELRHRERIRRIEEAVDPTPAFAVAGAAYRGLGIPACIRDGQRAADLALRHAP